MRAISLWQPWASAIPLGLKRVETRGWKTDYRGPLAIHAAKRWTVEQRKFTEKQGLSDLPFGAIIAVCNLFNLVPIELLSHVSNIEKSYGDYSPGRYGWILTDIVALPEPIPFKGGQGFFNVPDIAL